MLTDTLKIAQRMQRLQRKSNLTFSFTAQPNIK